MIERISYEMQNYNSNSYQIISDILKNNKFDINTPILIANPYQFFGEVIYSNKDTLLHKAVEINLDLVSLLVSCGADINARNRYGVTPLMRLLENLRWGRIQGPSEIADFLIAIGADYSIKNNDNENCFVETTPFYKQMLLTKELRKDFKFDITTASFFSNLKSTRAQVRSVLGLALMFRDKENFGLLSHDILIKLLEENLFREALIKDSIELLTRTDKNYLFYLVKKLLNYNEKLAEEFFYEPISLEKLKTLLQKFKCVYNKVDINDELNGRLSLISIIDPIDFLIFLCDSKLCCLLLSNCTINPNTNESTLSCPELEDDKFKLLHERYKEAVFDFCKKEFNLLQKNRKHHFNDEEFTRSGLTLMALT